MQKTERGKEISELNVAMIGCGRTGRQHAGECAKLGARVAILCDPDRERAQELGQNHPTARITNRAEEIDWRGIDAAFLCIPPVARGPIEIAAAQSGVHLFLEKPVGLSAAQAQLILEAVLRAGVLTAVGYMNRYRESVQQAKALCDEFGLLGMACYWVGSAYRVPWWGRCEESGGQLNEQCTHFFDLIRYYCGEIVEVAAGSQQPAESWCLEVDPAVAVTCRTKVGMATLYASCAASTKQIGIELFTGAKQISLDGWDLRLRGDATAAAATDPMQQEVHAFLSAVGGSPVSLILSDLADALCTQAAVDAAARAIKSRRWETVAS